MSESEPFSNRLQIVLNKLRIELRMLIIKNADLSADQLRYQIHQTLYKSLSNSESLRLLAKMSKDERNIAMSIIDSDLREDLYKIIQILDSINDQEFLD